MFTREVVCIIKSVQKDKKWWEKRKQSKAKDRKQRKIVISCWQVKSAYPKTNQFAHQTGHYHGFSSMKRLGIFLLPLGWDASPLQGYAQHSIRWYLGGEKHCESNVSCSRTQYSDHNQGSNPGRFFQRRAHSPWGHLVFKTAVGHISYF